MSREAGVDFKGKILHRCLAVLWGNKTMLMADDANCPQYLFALLTEQLFSVRVDFVPHGTPGSA